MRTIDAIDSADSLVGDRFQASLAEPLTLEGNVVVARDALVFGRLTQSKESGTFTGRSQLRLELTGIVVNGKTVPVVTGEYEATGSSRGASTAKRAIGGAALGALIGAAVDGGQGAAIGAGAGAGAGVGSEIITGGDQVKVPSGDPARLHAAARCVDTDAPELILDIVTREAESNAVQQFGNIVGLNLNPTRSCAGVV